MQMKIKLTAVDIHGKPVTSSNCQHRMDFINLDKEIIVTEYKNGKGVVLKTKLGEYQLPKHPTLNIYKGVCSGYKTHVTLKKMVGTLYYWI